ncbi:MAG: hypothetical protein DMG76_16490 [Acidobacteria bacterium]|jgi:hypothetical protein|nr:MAG: hypothetical protein DMG76_16490 [Acidobacteriota bacterium]
MACTEPCSSRSEAEFSRWNPVIELYFGDWAAMEVAWASREGTASDSDLPARAELTRATCSVVGEIMVLE